MAEHKVFTGRDLPDIDNRSSVRTDIWFIEGNTVDYDVVALDLHCIAWQADNASKVVNAGVGGQVENDDIATLGRAEEIG